MMLHNSFGVDLGSSVIKIYDHRKDTIIKEKNMIAIRRNGQILGIGNDAYEMFEKTPVDVKVQEPISNGKIGDVFQVEAILHTILNRSGLSVGRRPVLYFAVPTGLTKIEKRAYYTVARRGKLRKCKIFLVDRPVLDAIALGIPLNRTRGSMIINMGSQSTEVSVIADGRVIISTLIPIGGGQFNDAIRSNIRKKNNLLVGIRTARRLKLALADMDPQKKEGRKVMGMDCVNGIPRDGIVTSSTVNTAIMERTKQMAAEIRKVIQRIPPQIRANIKKEGIYLTGGSTRIPHMDKFLSKELDYSVQLSLYYDLCTVCGLKELITHPALHHFAYPVTKQ
ncbi:rod shape-determining protein [Novisyntrophococcus fermenticellae]|uniref:rod shape-determining protein n=1 Tax=Novisyntrophococcus fermenticellae TaxID=2068655 RepID=UPI001E5C4ABC|nr:rod shape-determining protein [Novisyntrophococcus fermenticellae]